MHSSLAIRVLATPRRKRHQREWRTLVSLCHSEADFREASKDWTAQQVRQPAFLCRAIGMESKMAQPAVRVLVREWPSHCPHWPLEASRTAAVGPDKRKGNSSY